MCITGWCVDLTCQQFSKLVPQSDWMRSMRNRQQQMK
ncbi:Uncharacterised protein [Vibrio cholerae]|nr:Uncharacterised protein [Vibrio cholerae]CSI72232.1 Uncharacterised protein [Vibrio cholerae]